MTSRPPPGPSEDGFSQLQRLRCDVHRPLNVDSSRPECANSGHVCAGWPWLNSTQLGRETIDRVIPGADIQRRLSGRAILDWFIRVVQVSGTLNEFSSEQLLSGAEFRFVRFSTPIGTVQRRGAKKT